MTTNNLDKKHEPRTTRTTRTTRTWASSSFTALGPLSREDGETFSLDSSSNRFGATTDTPFFVRDFRVFRGLKYSGHSVLESRTANDANMEKQTNTNFCGENDNEHSR